jgi:ABC-type xylose transport system permease subunit
MAPVVDVMLVLCAVALAAAHIFRTFARTARPACGRAPQELDAAPVVVVGGALARGVARARARRP